MKKLTTLFFMCCFSIILIAQSPDRNYSLLLQSGTIQYKSNVAAYSNQTLNHWHDSFNGRCYLLIQFNNIPTSQQKQAMEAEGIHLLSYVPHYAFLVSVSQNFDATLFSKHDVRVVTTLSAKDKLQPNLAKNILPDIAINQQGTIDLNILIYGDVNKENAIIALKKMDASILPSQGSDKTITLRIAQNKLNAIASLPFVEYVEPVSGKAEPDDTKGRSLHRSNTINSTFQGPSNFNGNGVHIALADDGSINHIDFTGRLTDYTAGTPGGNHGDMTSGICVGAGNLDPVIRGMADGADLYLFETDGNMGYYPQINNAVTNFANDSIVITSTSYTQPGFQNTYGAYGQFADQTIYDNPQLEFVFSAGNANGTDYNYGAGGQWGNISGAYKMGKNVIACANVDAFDVLDNTSSHGPANDGRVKPDITANGAGQMSTDENNGFQVGGGTSASCPGMAGITAQMYQVYKSLNGGAIPHSGLIKACLLNSADEIGNPGPDYKYGWGRVNVRRAYLTLSQNNYASDNIIQGQQKTFTINIPAGITKAKIMVYWQDFGGSPAAAKALVNDLNMTVTDPASNILLPLILDPTPNATTLNYPAVAGVDTLNNMEQVTIDFPSAGTYTVTVDGFEVPQGPQEIFVVYDLLDDGVKMTYPWSSEGFRPGEQEELRWDAEGTTQTFTLEYSTDNAVSWNLISNSIAGNVRQLNWIVPSTVSDQCFIRVTRNGISDMNDLPFTIMEVPQNIQIIFECPDSVGLQWSAVPGAIGYKVYMLGQKYMDVKGTSTTTSFTVTGTNSNADHWFSVSAIGPNNGDGRRALAFFKAAGTVNCPVAIDMQLTQIVTPSTGSVRDCQINTSFPVRILMRSLSINTVSNFDVHYQLNSNPIVTETYTGNLNTFDTAYFTFATPVNISTFANYTLQVWISVSGDMNPSNDLASSQFNIVFGNSGTAPITEDFQNAFPALGWYIINPDNATTWVNRPGLIGISGLTTTAAYLDNYNYNAAGQEDYLETRVVDLTSANYSFMTFDVADAAYSAAYVDALRVDISTDCGGSFFPTGYFKSGLTLSSIPNYVTGNQAWIPASASDWRTDTIVLDQYVGNQIIIRFVSITGYGNSLYIDNVNITNTPVGISEHNNNTGISIYPNPATGVFNVTVIDSKDNTTDVLITDAFGRLIKKASHNFVLTKNLQLDLSGFSKGVYFVELKSEHQDAKTKVVIY